MKRNARAILVAALLVAGGTGQVVGQNPGIPVHGGGTGTGITFAGTVGFTGDLSPTLGGTAFAASATLGAGLLGVTGIVSRFRPSGPEDGRTSVGANATLKVFGGPLIPLAAYLLAGASRTSLASDVTLTEIPLGIGFALTIPSPIFAIKPWLAPRLQVSRLSDPVNSSTDNTFAYSAGVDLTLLSGLGFRAAYDKIRGYDPTVSFGVNYGVRVRGL